MPAERKLPVNIKGKGYKPLKLALPTEDSVPETNMERYSYFIYGKQGIGKTTFSIQFPDALHMMFEPGAKSKALRKIEPLTWKEVEEYARLIAESEMYKTVVIDTVDLMYDMCAAQVCKDKGVDYLKDIGFGDGYKIAGNRLRNVLIKIHNKKGLVILSHDKVKMKTKDSDPDYTIPSSEKRCSDTIAKWADVAGHYYISNQGNRFLRIRANNVCEAKCRPNEFFNYNDGTPIMDIHMGTNEKESFFNFKRAFENQLENPIPKPKQKTKQTFKLK